MKKLLFTFSPMILLITALSFTNTSFAQGGANSYTVPLNYALYSSCAGELIDISGNLHVVVHTSALGKKKTMFTYHSNYAGVSGIGRNSGDIYTINGAGNTKVSLGNGITSYSFNTTVNMIGKGKAANQKIHNKNTVIIDWSTSPITITNKNTSFSLTCH